MSNYSYKFNGAVSGTTFAGAAENVKTIHAALSRKRDDLGNIPKFAIHLEPDPTNQYDANAVKIFVNTQLYGKAFIGHISARSFCPFCDTNQVGHGHANYGKNPVSVCPQCDSELTDPDNKKIAELLKDPDSVVTAHAFFVGGTAGKENIGIRYQVLITVPNDGVSEVAVEQPISTLGVAISNSDDKY